MSRLFGTDGVRGIANLELTGELAYRLGRSVVISLGEHGQSRPRIALGRDTRASGEFLEAALAAGVCSAGGDAILLGVCSTPGVAFLTPDLDAQAGVVISASHNPAEYNGLKFFGSSGYKLPDDVEHEIETLIDSDSGPRPTGRGVGRMVSVDDALDRYLKHLERLASASLDGMRVVGQGGGDTVMANLGFRRAMDEAGIKVVETKVGDRYVLEGLLQSGGILGGEQSGHIIFLRHATTGDGLLTAVQFLAL